MCVGHQNKTRLKTCAGVGARRHCLTRHVVEPLSVRRVCSRIVQDANAESEPVFLRVLADNHSSVQLGHKLTVATLTSEGVFEGDDVFLDPSLSTLALPCETRKG